MSSIYKPGLSTTGIGSVPFFDSDQAASFLFDAGLTIPFWPQLPKRCFAEEMIPQYSEGMPCVRVEADQERILFDPANRAVELEEFYTKFLADDPDLFPISSDVAAGLYAFQRLAANRTWPCVKGHTTGPITFCTGIYDADKNPLYSDPDLRDAAVKTIVRKVQWQIKFLKPFSSGRVLIFVDEPVLAAYGSSTYIYVSEEAVVEMLGEVFSAITDAGAIPGIHICGNSDWGMIVRSGVQVVNFDAYQYGASISLYANDIKTLFERGGSIAWGIVPTTTAVNKESAQSLTQLLLACFDGLMKKGISKDLLRERAIITPSCGAGSLAPDVAKRVFDLLAEVRNRMR
ncbi:MAG: hypothetical protein WCO42_00225 [bacterium]